MNMTAIELAIRTWLMLSFAGGGALFVFGAGRVYEDWIASGETDDRDAARVGVVLGAVSLIAAAAVAP